MTTKYDTEKKFPDNGRQVQWKAKPSTVLLILKPDPEIHRIGLEMASHLHSIHHLRVFVEPNFLKSLPSPPPPFLETWPEEEEHSWGEDDDVPDPLPPREKINNNNNYNDRKTRIVSAAATSSSSSSSSSRRGLHRFTTTKPSSSSSSFSSSPFPLHPPLPPKSFPELSSLIDLLVTVGGDGTLLFAASLFPSSPPPPALSIFAGGSLGFLAPFKLEEFENQLKKVLAGDFCVLVDRGQSPFLCNLVISAQNEEVTRIQGDGIIIATPTGSTAYSLSAGGSMVHPGVSCLLFTPICAHSLSSRPLLFPSSMQLKVQMAAGSRGKAHVSVDGRDRLEIQEGDVVQVQTSPWPLSLICNRDATQDWFMSVRSELQWNVRRDQLPFSDETKRMVAKL